MALLNGSTGSPRPVNPTALTTSVATIYTAPAYTSYVTTPSATSRLIEIIACNTAASAITVTIYKVPSGGTAGTGNAIWYGVSDNTGDSKILAGTYCFMAPGDTIQASASATGVTLTPSVVEFQ